MGKLARATDHTDKVPTGVEASDYRPRTPLGERLWNLRQQIERSGMPLLDWDDIQREVAERRGEQDL